MNEKAILLVDTDKAIIRDVTSTLEAEGYLVFIASNKNDGITTAKKVLPSLIFINIAMKEVSGLEISKALHDMEALADVPIVILTPHGGSLEPRYTALYGIIDFLKTPFTPEELVSKTIDMLELRDTGGKPGEAFSADTEAEEGPVLQPREESLPEPVTLMDTEAAEEKAGKQAEEFSKNLFRERTITASPETKGPLPSEEPKTETEQFLYEESSDAESAASTQWADEEKRPQRDDTARKYKTKHKSNKILVFALIPLLLVAAVVWILYYIDFFQWKKPETAMVAKRVQPAPQDLPKADTSPGQRTLPQSPQPEVEKNVSVPPVEKSTEPASPESKAQAPSNIKTKAAPPQGPLLPPKAGPGKKPAPAPKAEAKKAPFYAVQLGAFKGEANAEALAKKYKDKGHDAFIFKSKNGKGTFFKVLIGKFEKKNEAVHLSEKLKSAEGIKPLVVQESGNQ